MKLADDVDYGREVEDVEHFLLHCDGMAEREGRCAVRVMNEIMEGWQEMDRMV